MNDASPNLPPTNGDRKVVYESSDNPVVRERGLEQFKQELTGEIAKQRRQIFVWLGVITIILFVPPDQRVEVVKQLPSAFVGTPLLPHILTLF